MFDELFYIHIIIIVLSLITGWLLTYLFFPSKKEKNLKELITKEFGCIYCENFYYNNDGSGECLRDIRHPIYEICFKPDIKKIEEVLTNEDYCDRTSSRKN